MESQLAEEELEARRGGAADGGGTEKRCVSGMRAETEAREERAEEKVFLGEVAREKWTWRKASLGWRTGGQR